MTNSSKVPQAAEGRKNQSLRRFYVATPVRQLKRNCHCAVAFGRGFFRPWRVPIDPFTGSNETWEVETETASLSVDGSAPVGIADVHSGSQDNSLEGTEGLLTSES